MSLEEKIKNLIKETIEDMGYELLKVNLGCEEGKRALMIFINKKGGVSVEDCAKVSRTIEPILDQADLIKESYILIVSSPGI